MNLFDEEINKMLKIDPLLEAEKMTGKSYKEDEATNMLGLMLHFSHSKNKDALLSLNDDTTYSTETNRYLGIVEALGFQVILTDYFKDEERNKYEAYYVLYHPDGVLLYFDTYGEKVNSGKMIYNWKPHDINNFSYDILSSGCWNENDIWAGDHDCREAIKHNFNQLKKHGSFLNPWEVKPYTRLINYMEYRLYSKLDHKRWEEVCKPIELERMSRLPKEVQKMISCNK